MADDVKVRGRSKSNKSTKLRRRPKLDPEELFSDESQDRNTKGILNDYLKVKGSEKEKNKKSRTLERLKKSNSQDQLIIKNNLFDPKNDIDKSKKKVHRSKSSDHSLDEEMEKLKKDLKKKSKSVDNSKDEGIKSDKLLKKTRNKSKERIIEQNAIETPEVTPRKRTKKKRPDLKNRKDDEIKLDENQESEIQEIPKKVKTRKAKKPSDEIIEEIEQDKDETKEVTKVKKVKKKKIKTEIEEVVQRPETPLQDIGEVLSVTIHRTDKLLTDYHIAHPIVRVYVANGDTGRLIDKHDLDRAVTSYYEQDKRKISQILPIMTQPFSFRDHNSTLPVWEEILVFNENFNYFIKEKPNVIIFFEIIDFVSMNRANEQSSDAYGDGDGWHRIAWAFLKICGANSALNVGTKSRLQLYHIPSNDSFPRCTDVIELYKWWKYAKCLKYPSTLYVTVKPVTPPSEIAACNRSMYATQQELGFSSKLADKDTRQKSLTRIQNEAGVLWTRLPGIACKVPNNLKHTLNAGSGGCLVVKFSPNGRFLACGGFDVTNGHSITIFEIPSSQVKVCLIGHFGIIYDLDWSTKSDILLSSSADSTARIWDTSTWEVRGVLPHPSYVYCGRVHPRVHRVLATSCYDNVIRVWASPQTSTPGGQRHAELLQEIALHNAHVNALCFDVDGKRLFSADSSGCVCVWNVYVTDKPSSKGLLRDWTLSNKLTDNSNLDKTTVASQGKAIGCLSVHPNGNRLLVHSRDNVIRIGMVMQQYFGLLNFRDLVRSSISSCGGFVFAGSEDGRAYVWNSETGDQIASYTELNYTNTVSCADLHPGEDMVAFCAFGDNQNVLVYTYDKELAMKDIGVTLTPLHNNISSKQHPNLKKYLDDSARLNDFKESRMMEDSVKLEKVRRLLGTIPTEPCTLSPHSNRDLSLVNQQYRLASNQHTASASNRFLPVGRSGSKPPSAANQMSLNRTETGTKFTYQSVDSINLERCDKVLAIHDYIPQRSDELSFCRGDRIAILHRDNASWWMGEKLTGRHKQQGYLPSNYVTAEIDDADKKSEIITIETEDYTDGPVSAVKNKYGDLKFISISDSMSKHTDQSKDKIEDLDMDDLLAPLTNKKKKTNLKSKFKSINESVV